MRVRDRELARLVLEEEKKAAKEMSDKAAEEKRKRVEAEVAEARLQQAIEAAAEAAGKAAAKAVAGQVEAALAGFAARHERVSGSGTYLLFPPPAVQHEELALFS